jgi:hypothetical protein
MEQRHLVVTEQCHLVVTEQCHLVVKEQCHLVVMEQCLLVVMEQCHLVVTEAMVAPASLLERKHAAEALRIYVGVLIARPESELAHQENLLSRHPLVQHV